MIKLWNHFINASKLFYSQFNETSFLSSDSGYIFRNKLINTDITILTGDDINKQISLVNDKCVDNTIIFNLEKDRNALIEASPDFKLEMILSSPFMYGKGNGDIYPIQYYDNIRIERIQENPVALKDYINIYSEFKKIDSDNLIINNNIFDSNFFTYVAYHNSILAGTSSVVNDNGCAMVMNAYVLPRFRESGILSAMAKRGMHDLSKNGIQEYSTVGLSPHPLNRIMSHGLSIQFMCDIWRKNVYKA